MGKPNRQSFMKRQKELQKKEKKELKRQKKLEQKNAKEGHEAEEPVTDNETSDID